MPDPQAALALIHADLLAVQADAEAIGNFGPRRHVLASGVLAAGADSDGGTQAACNAAIADLAAVQDEAQAFLSGGPRVRRVAQAAIDALTQLQAIAWAEPGPPPPATDFASRRGIPLANGRWFSGITTTAGKGAMAQHQWVTQARGGRAQTCMTLFQGGANASSWDQYVKAYQKGSSFQLGFDGPLAVQAGILPILTVPTLIDGEGANFAAAAAGAYVPHWKEAALAAKQWLTGKFILRPDRESDDRGQTFGAENDPSPGHRNFIATQHLHYQVWADLFGADNVILSFCLTKRGSRGLTQWYPGDDIVDIIDCDFYCNTPRCTAERDWTRNYMPLLGTFYEFAATHGKFVGHSEWGIKVLPPGGPENDNDVFISELWAWLSEHAAMVSHENVYNPDGHGIVPIGGSNGAIQAPNAARAYASIWSAMD